MVPGDELDLLISIHSVLLFSSHAFYNKIVHIGRFNMYTISLD